MVDYAESTKTRRVIVVESTTTSMTKGIKLIRAALCASGSATLHKLEIGIMPISGRQTLDVTSHWLLSFIVCRGWSGNVQIHQLVFHFVPSNAETVQS
jgi:hypothetical protein